MRRPDPRVALALLAGAFVSIAALAFLVLGPIAQPQSYHRFADTRPLLGMPNAWDVLSNLAFVAVGIAGLVTCTSGRAVAARPWERAAWTSVFATAVAIALGSAYYHLAPDDARLVWDRIPIAVVFALLCGIIVGERADAAAGPWFVVPLVVVAVASVLVWKWADDLRLYGLFQVLPVVIVPLAVLLLRPRYDRFGGYVLSAALYGVAKVLEFGDRTVLHATRLVSGHTLKHFTAAAALAVLIPMLKRRRELGP